MASGSNWIGFARLQHLRATGLWNRRSLRDLGKFFEFPTFPQPRRREELSRLTGLSVTFSMRQYDREF